jgi:hypothetical protein
MRDKKKNWRAGIEKPRSEECGCEIADLPAPLASERVALLGMCSKDVIFIDPHDTKQLESSTSDGAGIL